MRMKKQSSARVAPTPSPPPIEVELRSLERIKPYPGNAKNHPPEQITMICELMLLHGFDQPIVIDRKGLIIKGHGRFMAAQQLKLTHVPVIVSTMSEVHAIEARIADNRVAQFGWNFDALIADVVEGVANGLNPDNIGWTLKELGLEHAPQEAQDAQPDGTGEIKLGKGIYDCEKCGFNFGPTK